MRGSGLETRWDRLAAEAPPFLRPEFFLATAQWLPPPGRPVFASIERGGELVAMLPLVHCRGTLLPLRSVHTPRYDLVGDPSALPPMWQRLRDRIEWHVMRLRGVPQGSPLATELEQLARRDGCAVEVTAGNASPYLPLEDLEQRLGGDFRRDLMAGRRKLHDIAFERVTRADPLALEDFYRIEAAAWKGEAGTAIATDPALRCFYAELARRFARRGALSLCFLRAGGRRIAASFALEDRGTHYLLRTGHDPAHAPSMPGHLLLWEAALDARARGLREIDFLAQDVEWKRAWTDRVRRHVRLEIYRPTARGRAAHALRHRVCPALGRLFH